MPTSSSDTSPLAPLRKTPHAATGSDRAKQRDGGRNSKCGRETSEGLIPTTGKAEWIASMRVGLARTLAWLEKERGWKENAPASGLKSCDSFAQFDHATRSWKTHQRLLAGGLESFSETWPSWGMLLHGACYRHPPLVPHKYVHAGGVLPTLTAMDAKPITGGDLFVTKTGSVRARNKDGSCSNRGLSTTVAMIPALTASAAKSGQKYGRGGLTTTGYVKMFPALEASDAQRGPDSRDRPNSGGPNLLAALTARDWKSGKASQATMDRNSRPLSEQIGGPLNPAWCEWFMGWPIGSTELKPSATAKSRSAPQRRGASSKPAERKDRSTMTKHERLEKLEAYAKELGFAKVQRAYWCDGEPLEPGGDGFDEFDIDCSSVDSVTIGLFLNETIFYVMRYNGETDEYEKARFDTPDEARTWQDAAPEEKKGGA